MAKLSNGIEFYNVNFPAEYGEYLLTNGYRCILQDEIQKNKLLFQRENMQIRVSDNSFDVYVYKKELLGEESMKWVYAGGYDDLTEIDFFGFIALLHDLRVVSVLHFLRDEKAKGSQYYNEAKLIAYSLI